MSVDINWEALTQGPSGRGLEASIRDFIHHRFQQITLPRFIQSVQVHSFEFGAVPPQVILEDICDPFPEFYQEEEAEEEREDDGASPENERAPIIKDPAYFNEDAPPLSKRRQRKRSFAAHPETSVQSSNIENAFPRAIDTRNTRLRLIFPFPAATNSDNGPKPLLGVSTPGIPGGTSNLGYYHLPISAGLRSGTQNPLAAVAGAHYSTIARQDPPPQQKTDLHERHCSISSTISSSTSHPHSPAAPHDTSQDFQTHLRIDYSGPLRISLTADILLDYPMPSFVGIPVRLTITGLSFSGLAILAMIFQSQSPSEASASSPAPSRSRTSSQTSQSEIPRDNDNKACFCFLPSAASEAHPSNDLGGGPASLLREIKVESEIGKREDGKAQSLKNVGKVERFVVEQVRRVFEEEVVWPSFWTFLL